MCFLVIFKVTSVVEPLVASNILTLESWWSMTYLMLVFSIVSLKCYLTVLAFKFVAWVFTNDVLIYCCLVFKCFTAPFWTNEFFFFFFYTFSQYNVFHHKLSFLFCWGLLGGGIFLLEVFFWPFQAPVFWTWGCKYLSLFFVMHLFVQYTYLHISF